MRIKCIAILLILATLFSSFNIVNASEIDKKKKEIKVIEEEYSKTNEELRKLDEEINTSMLELQELLNEIEEYDDKIQNAEETIEDLSREIDDKFEKLANRLKSVYLDEGKNPLSLLLENPSDSLMSKYEMSRFIIKYNETLLNEIRSAKDRVEMEDAFLKIERKMLEEAKLEAEKRQEKLNKQLAEKQSILEDLNKDKVNREAEIARIYKRIKEDAKKVTNLPVNNNNLIYNLLFPSKNHRRISSDYGERTHPISYESSFHTGIDIPAPAGSPVLASEDGVVSTAGWLGGYGYAVIIVHNNTVSTLYGHNSSLNVKQGDIVKKGDVIAKVGSTGRSTGPHIHYEVRLNNKHTNPWNYLK